MTFEFMVRGDGRLRLAGKDFRSEGTPETDPTVRSATLPYVPVDKLKARYPEADLTGYFGTLPVGIDARATRLIKGWAAVAAEGASKVRPHHRDEIQTTLGISTTYSLYRAPSGHVFQSKTPQRVDIGSLFKSEGFNVLVCGAELNSWSIPEKRIDHSSGQRDLIIYFTGVKGQDQRPGGEFIFSLAMDREACGRLLQQLAQEPSLIPAICKGYFETLYTHLTKGGKVGSSGPRAFGLPVECNARIVLDLEMFTPIPVEQAAALSPVERFKSAVQRGTSVSFSTV